MITFECAEFSFNQSKIKNVTVNDLQKQYLSVFSNERSIEKTVHFFLKSGWLVNFNQLYSLILMLDAAQVLVPSIKDLQRANPSQSSHPVLNFSNFCRWPFFRSLPPPVQSLFWKNHQVVKFPMGTTVIKAKDHSRDLWMQLSGQSAIYTNQVGTSKKFVGVVDPMSVFGEFGFFLNSPRSADIETLMASEFVRIPYTDEMDPCIHKDVFAHLSTRFNVLRAILHSPVLKTLPETTVDELIFSGRLIQVPANKIIFQQGDKGSSCYFVIQGQVGVFKDGSLINRLSQGSALGEIALFWSQGLRTAAAVSQGDCLLLEIHQKQFYSILAKHLHLAAELETLAFERGQQDLNRKKRAA